MENYELTGDENSGIDYAIFSDKFTFLNINLVIFQYSVYFLKKNGKLIFI